MFIRFKLLHLLKPCKNSVIVDSNNINYKKCANTQITAQITLQNKRVHAGSFCHATFKERQLKAFKCFTFATICYEKDVECRFSLSFLLFIVSFVVGKIRINTGYGFETFNQVSEERTISFDYCCLKGHVVYCQKDLLILNIALVSSLWQ